MLQYIESGSAVADVHVTGMQISNSKRSKQHVLITLVTTCVADVRRPVPDEQQLRW